MTPDRHAYEWATKQLERYTYRPKWNMWIERRGHDRELWDAFPMLCIDYEATDAYHHNSTVMQRFRTHVPGDIIERRDEEYFALWLQDTLFEVEQHESREFLHRDGVIYDDPHKTK